MKTIHRIQTLFLAAGAIGWGISIVGSFLPWRMMDIVLQNMGAAAPVTDSQLQYWFRMAMGAWSVIGFLFLVVLQFPAKYRNLVPLLAAIKRDFS